MQLGQFENLQSELGSEAVGFDGRRQNYKFHSGARRQSSWKSKLRCSTERQNKSVAGRDLPLVSVHQCEPAWTPQWGHLL